MSVDVLFNNTNSKELVGKTCLIENEHPRWLLKSHDAHPREARRMRPEFPGPTFAQCLAERHFHRACEQMGGASRD